MNISYLLHWAKKRHDGINTPMPSTAITFFADLDDFVADLGSDELPFMHELYDWMHKAIYDTEPTPPEKIMQTRTLEEIKSESRQWWWPD